MDGHMPKTLAHAAPKRACCTAAARKSSYRKSESVRHFDNFVARRVAKTKSLKRSDQALSVVALDAGRVLDPHARRALEYCLYGAERLNWEAGEIPERPQAL